MNGFMKHVLEVVIDVQSGECIHAWKREPTGLISSNYTIFRATFEKKNLLFWQAREGEDTWPFPFLS